MYWSLSAPSSVLVTSLGRSNSEIAVPSNDSVPWLGREMIFTWSSVSPSESEKPKFVAEKVYAESSKVDTVLLAPVGGVFGVAVTVDAAP